MGIQVTLPDSYLTSTPANVRDRKEYEVSGVYIFFDGEECLYVGKTVNFRTRFRKHRTDSDFFYRADSVRLYLVTDEYEKDVYETFLIKELQPVYNRAKTFYHRADYGEMLNRVDHQLTDAEFDLEVAHERLEDVCGDNEDALIDVGERDDEELLGESLFLQREIAEIKHSINKLRARKATIMRNLSS